MRYMRTRRVTRLAALGVVVGLTAGFAGAGHAQSVSGQAYGAYVNTPLASQARSPLAVLPQITAPNGDIATADADVLNVPNAVSSDFLNSSTTGAIGTTTAGAQSIASVADINILGGLVTAKTLSAIATSGRGASGAWSDANGSTFQDLVVNGVPVTVGDAAVAPNTRLPLPGVGYVVLNEQSGSGDGVTSSGITVNMIHVVLQDALTGVQTGEIIVGSATSSVGF
jgi:hypothetical protein